MPVRDQYWCDGAIFRAVADALKIAPNPCRPRPLAEGVGAHGGSARRLGRGCRGRAGSGRAVFDERASRTQRYRCAAACPFGPPGEGSLDHRNHPGVFQHGDPVRQTRLEIVAGGQRQEGVEGWIPNHLHDVAPLARRTDQTGSGVGQEHPLGADPGEQRLHPRGMAIEKFAPND